MLLEYLKLETLRETPDALPNPRVFELMAPADDENENGVEFDDVSGGGGGAEKPNDFTSDSVSL
jgi:hypothetical protein